MHIFPDQAALEAICRHYGIRRLSLFGSTLKGAGRPDSDVDLLVEFEPEATPNLLTMAEIELALSPLLGGRKVDLRTAGDLSRYFRDEVVGTAEPQYEAANVVTIDRPEVVALIEEAAKRLTQGDQTEAVALAVRLLLKQSARAGSLFG